MLLLEGDVVGQELGDEERQDKGPEGDADDLVHIVGGSEDKRLHD